MVDWLATTSFTSEFVGSRYTGEESVVSFSGNDAPNTSAWVGTVACPTRLLVLALQRCPL